MVAEKLSLSDRSAVEAAISHDFGGRMDWQKLWILRDAASELLALKENGQTVWWCVKHDSKSATPMLSVIGQQVGMCQQYSLTPSEGQGRCRFVEASLHIHREGT